MNCPKRTSSVSQSVEHDDLFDEIFRKGNIVVNSADVQQDELESPSVPDCVQPVHPVMSSNFQLTDSSNLEHNDSDDSFVPN
ncbi:hypothetical protein WDU94_015588 [Cyamophila willieti]